MDIDELMRLRLYAKSNANKVINKDVFLSVLDSHIRLSTSLDDNLSIQVRKPLQRANMSVYEGARAEQVRLPPNMEQVRKAYNA